MPQAKPLILIVDDIPANILVMAEALQHGYHVKVADNGLTALEIARQQPQPELVLLDVMMPNMDGYEVCRRLKVDEQTRGIDVVFVTAKDDETDEVRGLQLGAVDYLTKPVSIPVALARINNLIQLRQRKKRLLDEIAAHETALEHLRVAGLVYQNTSEAMILTDESNNIVAINPAFSKITGYEEHEVLGKNPKLLSSGKQDALFYQSLWNALETSGNWQGEIWNRRKDGKLYAEWLTINTIYNKNGSVRQRVALFSDITEKKSQDELIWRQANYDPLTNLPNRRLFQDRLAHELKKAKRDHTELALFFIDLDRFKEINDTQGHDMGDQLLVEAARRLLQCVRESDTVARLGGDEFTLILPNLSDVASIERIANNIQSQIKEPFKLAGHSHHISASIGITRYPQDASDLDNLLKNADQAMYTAKDNGRGQFTYFSPEMQSAAQARAHLLHDLRMALEENHFKLLYQPIYDISENGIEKVEALLRWEHPRRGRVLPDQFIPLAEDTGLIVQIGDWVFREAVRQLKYWLDLTGRPVQVGINVSPRQFASGKAFCDWPDVLAEHQIPCGSIVLEITERLLLNAGDSIVQQMQRLKSAGFKIALDDFGTGYSALSYLKNFQIDYIKIDRSFVKDLAQSSTDRVLSEAIIAMAHKMNCQVIAEGVETLEQKHFLVDAKCDAVQGFLYSLPLSPEELAALLQKQRGQQ